MGKGIRSNKGATIGVRVSPEFKWALELIAREHRRSISGTVEWAIKNAYREMFDVAIATYSENNSERVKALANSRPDLLTVDEREFI